MGIPHHLLDIVNPDEEFNASLYREYAVPVIEDILSRNRVCLVVGGTGLYIKSLLGGLFDCPQSDPTIRARLLNEYDSQGKDALYDRLKKVDPVSASTIHSNDRVRITRALEIFELTGKPFSEMVSGHLFGDSEFLPLKICLCCERDILYERINMRSIKMFESGLVEETEKLLAKGYSSDLKPLKSIGYRHVMEYLKGRAGYDESVELLKQDTRRYAKRQMTWFRADTEMLWCSPENPLDIVKKIKDFI
jgi:tRNA dimethylallyltransferase